MAESRRRPAHAGRRTSNVAAAFMTDKATARVSRPVAIVRRSAVPANTYQQVLALSARADDLPWSRRVDQ